MAKGVLPAMGMSMVELILGVAAIAVILAVVMMLVSGN